MGLYVVHHITYIIPYTHSIFIIMWNKCNGAGDFYEIRKVKRENYGISYK